jgi:hypothetical protein
MVFHPSQQQVDLLMPVPYQSISIHLSIKLFITFVHACLTPESYTMGTLLSCAHATTKLAA